MLIVLQISDQKCPLPMPPSKEVCNVPNCDGTQNTGIAPRLDARRQVRPNDHVDTFREGPILSLVSNVSDNEISSMQDKKFSFSAGGGWLHTEWSEVIMCLVYGIDTKMFLKKPITADWRLKNVFKLYRY